MWLNELQEGTLKSEKQREGIEDDVIPTRSRQIRSSFRYLAGYSRNLGRHLFEELSACIEYP